jgi:hypothetical protein
MFAGPSQGVHCEGREHQAVWEPPGDSKPGTYLPPLLRGQATGSASGRGVRRPRIGVLVTEAEPAHVGHVRSPVTAATSTQTCR